MFCRRLASFLLPSRSTFGVSRISHNIPTTSWPHHFNIHKTSNFNSWTIVQSNSFCNKTEEERYLEQQNQNAAEHHNPLVREKMFEECKEEAEQGFPDAIYNLAHMYSEGMGCEENPAEAFRLFKTLADQDFVEAKVNLGQFYLEGLVVDRDEEKAFELFKQACEKENVSAYLNIANCYLEGVGCEQNFDLGIQFLKKASDGGNADAQVQYGVFLMEDDPTEAFRLFSINAEKGHPDAMFNLGQAHIEGNCVPLDEDAGFQLISKAAEAGHVDSLFLLYKCYFEGIGVEANEDTADEYLQEAISKECADAQNHAGLIFLKNNYEKEAFELFKRAADNGLYNAQYNVAYCYQSGIGVEINEEEADRYYELAQTVGYPDPEEYLEEGENDVN